MRYNYSDYHLKVQLSTAVRDIWLSSVPVRLEMKLTKLHYIHSKLTKLHCIRSKIAEYYIVMLFLLSVPSHFAKMQTE